jgi:Domain of unknown function (DUF3885)
VQELITYLENNFKGINLIDSFSEYQHTLHLLLEVEHYQVDDNDEINPLYFNNVYANAKQVFNDVLDTQDELLVVFQTHKESHEKFKRLSIIDKFMNDRALTYKLKFNKINRENNEIHQFYLHCKKSDMNTDYLIQSICNQDFPTLEPRLKRYYGLVPEIFIINKTTDCILHFYDDRGCFILTKDNEKFEQYKDKYRNMILEE